MLRWFLWTNLLSVWLLAPILASKENTINWRIAETSSYTLVTDANLTSSHGTIEALHYLHQAFLHKFQIEERSRISPKRHLIFLPKSKKEIAALYPLNIDGEQLAADGVYIASYHLPTILSPAGKGRITETVYHEYTHHLANIHLGELPAWASEGIAELFSKFSIENSRITIGKMSRREFAQLKFDKTKIPWIEFFNKDNDQLLSSLNNHSQRASVFYAQSKLLAHYCYFSERPGMFDSYLALARRAEQDNITEFDTRTMLGLDFNQLDKALKTHQKNIANKKQTLDLAEFPKPPLIAFQAIDEAKHSLYEAHVFAIGRQFDRADEILEKQRFASEKDPLWHTTASELALLKSGTIEKSIQHSHMAYQLGSKIAFDATLSVYADIEHGDTAPKTLIARLQMAHEQGDRSEFLYEAYHQILYSNNITIDDEHADFLWEGLNLHPMISYRNLVVDLVNTRQK